MAGACSVQQLILWLAHSTSCLLYSLCSVIAVITLHCMHCVVQAWTQLPSIGPLLHDAMGELGFDLVANMLHFDHTLRLTAAQCLKHPFLRLPRVQVRTAYPSEFIGVILTIRHQCGFHSWCMSALYQDAMACTHCRRCVRSACSVRV